MVAWEGAAAGWCRLACDFLQAPHPFSYHLSPARSHHNSLTPRDLSWMFCQLYPLPQPPPPPAPPPAPATSPCCLPACLRHLIQGQPGLPPPGLLRAVTHSPCRLSASMSSPRICDRVGLRQVLGNKLRHTGPWFGMGQEHMSPHFQIPLFTMYREQGMGEDVFRFRELQPASLAEVGADSISLGPHAELGKLPLSSLPSTPGHLRLGRSSEEACGCYDY